MKVQRQIPMPEVGDRAFTREEAAALTPYTPKTLANLASLGVGPPFRTYRGRTFYLASELQAWMKNLPRGGGERPETK